MRALFRRVVAAAQRVVIAVLLFLVYYLGMPITLVLVKIFDRGLLARTPAGQDSYWLDVEGYEPDLDSAQRQS
jgi:hypothetical protein